jgi:hypothetical protein
MTDKQWFKFYLPAWSACADANTWLSKKGVFLGKQAPMFGRAEAGELYNQVWIAAQQLALAEHRALKPDDFRHACHIVALGRPKSSKDFTNAECDRVVCLFKILTNPDDIDALIEWDHPEIAAVKRLKWSIEHAAPDAYVRKIAADKFGTRLWEDLEEGQLRHLAMTLRHRRGAWAHQRTPAAAEAATSSDNPF